MKITGFQLVLDTGTGQVPATLLPALNAANEAQQRGEPGVITCSLGLNEAGKVIVVGEFLEKPYADRIDDVITERYRIKFCN